MEDEPAPISSSASRGAWLKRCYKEIEESKTSALLRLKFAEVGQGKGVVQYISTAKQPVKSLLAAAAGVCAGHVHTVTPGCSSIPVQPFPISQLVWCKESALSILASAALASPLLAVLTLLLLCPLFLAPGCQRGTPRFRLAAQRAEPGPSRPWGTCLQQEAHAGPDAAAAQGCQRPPCPGRVGAGRVRRLQGCGRCLQAQAQGAMLSALGAGDAARVHKLRRRQGV